jgi:hypothetical protein
VKSVERPADPIAGSVGQPDFRVGLQSVEVCADASEMADSRTAAEVKVARILKSFVVFLELGEDLLLGVEREEEKCVSSCGIRTNVTSVVYEKTKD